MLCSPTPRPQHLLFSCTLAQLPTVSNECSTLRPSGHQSHPQTVPRLLWLGAWDVSSLVTQHSPGSCTGGPQCNKVHNIPFGGFLPLPSGSAFSTVLPMFPEIFHISCTKILLSVSTSGGTQTKTSSDLYPLY